MNKTHWFYINSNKMEIYTYGKGNHPTTTYTFEEKEDYDAAVKRFMESDEYEFIKDQA